MWAKLDDAGIQPLLKMPHLSRLSIGGTQVTAAAVKKLQQALPNTIISTSTRSYQ